MRCDSRGLQIGQRGRAVRRLMGHLRPGFVRVRERLYDIAASLHHVAQSGGIARTATTARRLRRHGSGTAELATSTVGSPGL